MLISVIGNKQRFHISHSPRTLQVGTATPVEDFRELTSHADQAQFRAACDKMSNRLHMFIHNSFMDQHYQKAVDSLKVLRELCIQVHFLFYILFSAGENPR